MSATLPCPKCGYDMLPVIEDGRRRIRSMTDGLAVLSMTECHGCPAMLGIDHGLSPDGVGPERLVPVETNA